MKKSDTAKGEKKMSIVLSVYSQKAFKEFLLPAINNADYTITFQGEYFQIEEDIQLNMDVMGDFWSIKESARYKLTCQEKPYQGQRLRNGDVFKLITEKKEELYIFVEEVESSFHAYTKYQLKDIFDITIGSGAENDIAYNCRGMVSRKHAQIVKTGEGYKIINYSKNGIYLDSRRVEKEYLLEFGMYINIIGLHMVFLGDMLAVDTKTHSVIVRSDKLQERAKDSGRRWTTELKHEKSVGKTVYHRAPRDYEKIQEDVIEIEAPPQPIQNKRQPLYMTIGPSVTMVLPMLLGCVLMLYSSNSTGGGSYMFFGLIMSLTSTAVGIGWTLNNIRYQKKEEKEQEEHRIRTYNQYLDEKTEEIKKKYDQTTETLNRVYPNTKTCLNYDESRGILWNRNLTHTDFLRHRLGLGELPFQLHLNVPKKRFVLYKDELAERPEKIKEQYDTLYNVPITVDLMEKNLIGVIGGERKKGAIEIVKLLAAQIASNNCYTDVKLGFIYDKSTSADFEKWQYVKWLPHVWSEDKKTRFVASTKEEASDVFYELTKVLRMRMETEKNVGNQIAKPYYIVFVSDPSMLEGELISKYIFDRERNYGLTTVLLAQRYEELPNHCDFIIENTDKFQGMYEVSDAQDEKQKIKFDSVQDEELEQFARHLSSLCVLELEEGGEIPNALTFLEMLKVNRPEEIPVKELWAKNRTYENIRGQVGEKAGGVPCYLDVHEKYHGPHGLVAGTTGSGKSETLQTYLLSLAINYSPDDVAFFIIDYKGGGMANLFDGLPHMAGQISNLSGNQVRRAMISIQSENRRRQRAFTEQGVNNINSYTKLYKNREVKQPIPHLFIIVDEFAELKREEPEFMKELISVAQVGRSLGVHMILATQKPGGTVDENIWSNSKFRLCLRVQSQQDSKDMLHKPDAAYITQAGRCYLQVGNDEVYELFQSGYSGAAYDEDAADHKMAAVLIAANGKAEISSNVLKKGRRGSLKEADILRTLYAANKKKQKKTQLDAVKEYLSKVAEENRYTNKVQLWMPLLPACICLNEFKEYTENAFSVTHNWHDTGGEGRLEMVLGLIDDPVNQRQIPLQIDFFENGNVAVCGNVVSGKSTLLQTMCFALIQKYTPDAVQFYVLDFSSKMMAAFEDAPHCGGVMYENENDKIGKFFHMINKILEERKQLLRGGNYRQYVQMHGAQMPAVIIFIDDYGAFKEKTGGVWEEQLIRLSKEGISHGIYLAVSGKGYGMSDITTRVGENIKTVLCLALQDKYVYAEYLHSTNIEVVPETDKKGRGLVRYEKSVLEFQAAVAVDAENDYQRMEEIRKVCIEMKSVWNGKTAQKIPEIPEKPVWSEFSRLSDFKAQNQSAESLAVGYREMDAGVYGIPLSEIYCYLVCGVARTGKTNFMKVCIQAALEKNAGVLIIDDPRKPLRNYESSASVQYASDERSIFELFENLTPIFKERNAKKNQMLTDDFDEDEIFAEMSKEKPYFIFISDLIWFVTFVYQTTAKVDFRGFMETIIEKGRLHNIYFICELSLQKRTEMAGYRLGELFTRYRTGIHFGGKSGENPILSFGQLSFREQNKVEKAGIGIAANPTDEKVINRIVIPLARR